ncbi:MAG: hypothetical protein HOV67_19195 [Kribbellaceae bacterium]|nr:hypothetical protein [Kribbellaceae bacterium]
MHERGLRELPWFGPDVDGNPDNIMRTADGRLVAADLFSADGPPEILDAMRSGLAAADARAPALD